MAHLEHTQPSEYELQYEALESLGLEEDEIERAIEDYNEGWRI